MLVGLILVSFMAHAEDTVGTACDKAHKKAQVACAAHESALSAEALSIVSSETRTRVISSEKAKLEGILSTCRKVQEACALSCDEAIESATLDGKDIATPLDNLSDCRQGSIVKHMEAMRTKREQLTKMQTLKPEKRRAISNVGMR